MALINKNNKFKIIILLINLFFISDYCFAESIHVGKIDLSLAFLLHPQMSLFDYQRLGFYKIPLGLSENEFNDKIEELKNSIDETNPDVISIKKNIEELRKELISLIVSNKNNDEEIQKNIDEIKSKIEKIEFDLNNPDITNIEETKIIFLKINKEVIDTIKEVAKEKKLQAVFNNWVNYKNIFPINYINRLAFKPNTENPFENFYQNFFSSVVEATKSKTFPVSTYLSGWLEHERFPGQIDLLPLNSQPLVIFGADDILPEVIEKIYTKYKISSDIIAKTKYILLHNNKVKTNLFIKDK